MLLLCSHAHQEDAICFHIEALALLAAAELAATLALYVGVPMQKAIASPEKKAVLLHEISHGCKGRAIKRGPVPVSGAGAGGCRAGSGAVLFGLLHRMAPCSLRSDTDPEGNPCREDPGPSPALAPAVAELAAALARLAGALDAVAFRDLWRAVAVAATRLLFNEVATEARFSRAVRPAVSWPVAAHALGWRCVTCQPSGHLCAWLPVRLLSSRDADEVCCLRALQDSLCSRMVFALQPSVMR